MRMWRLEEEKGQRKTKLRHLGVKWEDDWWWWQAVLFQYSSPLTPRRHTSTHTPSSPPQHLAPALLWNLSELNSWQGVSWCDSRRRAKKKKRREKSLTYDNICFACNLLWQWSTPVLRPCFKKTAKKNDRASAGGWGREGNSWQIHLNDQKICLAGTFSAKCPLNRLTSCEWISWTPKYKPETESNYCLAQRRDWEQWRLIYKGNVIQRWEPLDVWLSNCNCSVSCMSGCLLCPSCCQRGLVWVFFTVRVDRFQFGDIFFFFACVSLYACQHE